MSHMKMAIRLRLMSDATFGRGDGVAGLIDAEIEHDEYGLPYLRGRTLKGLLVEECANLLYALHTLPTANIVGLQERAASEMFGQAGSTSVDGGMLHVGAAMLPDALRGAIRRDVDKKDLRPEEVLGTLTAIRRQTAVDEETGAPQETGLRSMRVLVREIVLKSQLRFAGTATPEMKGLLAACVLALHRAGTGRNRGRGRVEATLRDADNKDITSTNFEYFKNSLAHGARENAA
jgi:hypothetical protein